jgi:hypothetical protein
MKMISVVLSVVLLAGSFALNSCSFGDCILCGTGTAPQATDTATTAPQAPRLQNPPNGATLQSTIVDLIWTVSSGATSYAAQVATDSSFTSIVYGVGGLKGTGAEVRGLSNLTTYYWRVNATNRIGTSKWSETWIFRTAGTAP